MSKIFVYLIALSIIGNVNEVAWAQPTTRTPSQKQLCKQKPWYCDTTSRDRERALQLFSEGEELHDSALLAAASTKYRSALERWDHPQIHYYLMLALVKLDKPVEAYEHVVQALRHDADPLEGDEYATALDYQKLLQDKVAEVEVICEESDAVVTINGSLLFTGPDRMRQHIAPGKYEIRARKPGRLPADATLTLEPGKPVSVSLKLMRKEDKLRVRRPMPGWIPWLMVGGGGALGALGVTLQSRAGVDRRTFLDHYAFFCPQGCNTGQYPEQVQRLERRAVWGQRGAYLTYGLAGAATIVGVAVLFLNQPRKEIDPNAPSPVSIQHGRLSVTSVVSPDLRGASIALTF